MNVLIDTHIAIWAVTDSPKLSAEARDILTDENNEIFYSTASVWEVIIKHMIKPEGVEVDGDELARYCDQTGFRSLPIMNHHTYEVRTLSRGADAPPHNDPFDRLLLAQAKAEGMKFMTHDGLFPAYNEDCIIMV